MYAAMNPFLSPSVQFESAMLHYTLTMHSSLNLPLCLLTATKSFLLTNFELLFVLAPQCTEAGRQRAQQQWAAVMQQTSA